MYSDSERQIFRFCNGDLTPEGKPKVVFADPMTIWRGLAKVSTEGGKTYNDLVAVQARDTEYSPATEAARYDLIAEQTALLRQVFGLKPFDGNDGSGLTENEVLDVLNQFNEFVEGLKKKPTTSPDSSAPLDGPLTDSEVQEILRRTANPPTIPLAMGAGTMLPVLDESGAVVPLEIPGAPVAPRVGV